MSILALAATAFGALGLGLFLGAMVLRPNVGPWRIRAMPPEPPRPARPAVHVTAVTAPPVAPPVTPTTQASIPTVATGHLDPAVRDALAQYALTQFAQLPQRGSDHE